MASGQKDYDRESRGVTNKQLFDKIIFETIARFLTHISLQNLADWPGHLEYLSVERQIFRAKKLVVKFGEISTCFSRISSARP
jgi:hypothetical protein